MIQLQRTEVGKFDRPIVEQSVDYEQTMTELKLQQETLQNNNRYGL